MIRVFAAAMLFVMGSLSAQAEDSRVGYYYPELTSEEVFIRTINNPPAADRPVRVGFVTEITKAQLAAPESPRFVIFSKGSDAEHMVIVALDDEIFKTLYRARAVLAQLTSNARGTAFFKKNNLQVHATWFDLAKMLGFEDIVISDGDRWAHKITLN